MQFDEWEPVYRDILGDFGYSRAADERAREMLSSLVGRFDRKLLSELVGAEVVVAGAGPSLSSAVDRAAEAEVVVAASSAATRLRSAGVGVDVVVTDLDGEPSALSGLIDDGATVVVHAHGDNVDALQQHVPSLPGDALVATTQAEPRGQVRNFGGFTDGDRAAFLADHFGASELTLIGWDFDDPTLSKEKAQKLNWAARLLTWLEQRRDERFSTLDGRRRLVSSPA